MVLTERIPVAELEQQAREVRFGRFLATMVIGFFFAIGWVTGRLWFGAVFCALAVRQGFREGAKIPAGEPARQQ